MKNNNFASKEILGSIPIPRKSYLNECIPIGAPEGRKRWRSEDGKRYYEWDSLHGEIEVYNSRGKHLGVKDIKGNDIGDAVKGRKINV